jgi:hypothetical protein
MMVDKPTKQTKPTKPAAAVRKPLTIRTMTAMMPLLILVGAYWTLKIARRLTR